MAIRQATPADGEAIRDVVARSMQASYSLSPATIEAAVGEWFGDDALAEALAAADRRVLVAVRDGAEPGDAAAGSAEREEALAGVADVAVVRETDTGDVRWLHVDPDYRGEGLGRSLYEAAAEWLDGEGAEVVRGLVLADNADGTGFYRELGFERVGEREVDVDGTAHTEYVYQDSDQSQVVVVTEDGQEVYVDHADPSRGSLGLFFTAYADPECTDRYGYQCGHCGTLETAMDAMGRLECTDCGNTRKPTRWDAAYL